MSRKQALTRRTQKKANYFPFVEEPCGFHDEANHRVVFEFHTNVFAAMLQGFSYEDACARVEVSVQKGWMDYREIYWRNLHRDVCEQLGVDVSFDDFNDIAPWQVLLSDVIIVDFDQVTQFIASIVLFLFGKNQALDQSKN